jgi:hypothetical protein
MIAPLVRVLRMLLSAWLLLVVFNHAHWSVGLCLTLLLVANEFDSLVIKRLLADRKATRLSELLRRSG